MIGPIQLIRLVRINFILLKHGLTRPVIGKSSMTLRALSYLNPWSFSSEQETRGQALRKTLEKLGPIFVKFGQLLSTRRDLLPDSIANELEKLQDQVQPFSGVVARKIIEASLNVKIEHAFTYFDETPLASASIAQVHAAQLLDGSDVIIKVLRPNIAKTIEHDIALMYAAAKFTRYFWRKGRRLKPVELVAEFENTIFDELDLTREAANASQLRRNFETSTIMYVPKIYWHYVSRNVMVMERIYGIRISDIAALKAANTDLKTLAEYGVEIFFTQVLRDSFFHADMHPGNLFVDVTNPEKPRYLGVDFGIMGTLSPQDQHYLAANLLAFFNRDYREVAILHVESGWVPADTRIDQFESAIRTVCEPIFERPLKDISFGTLLLQLFRTAERFNMEVQPQLMLLQKTLLSIEGLGRQLYPDLDLWHTGKPFLEKWIRKQHSLIGLAKESFKRLPEMAERFMKAPDTLFDILNHVRRQQQLEASVTATIVLEATASKKRGFFLGAGSALAIVTAVATLMDPLSHWNWTGGSLAIVCLLVGWLLPTKS